MAKPQMQHNLLPPHCHSVVHQQTLQYQMCLALMIGRRTPTHLDRPCSVFYPLTHMSAILYRDWWLWQRTPWLEVWEALSFYHRWEYSYGNRMHCLFYMLAIDGLYLKQHLITPKKFGSTCCPFAVCNSIPRWQWGPAVTIANFNVWFIFNCFLVWAPQTLVRGAYNLGMMIHVILPVKIFDVRHER